MLTRFFQTKTIPPSSWYGRHYVMQFNFNIFIIAHFAGSVKKAADFLSRLELKVTEKISLKIQEDVQTTHNEVTTSTSDVADEKQFFFAQADCEDESENKPLRGKSNLGKRQQNGYHMRNNLQGSRV